MYPTSQCVWYRYPGSPFYIFANSVSCPRLFVQPSYHNPSHQNIYTLQRVIVDEVESLEQDCNGDVELNETIINVRTRETAMGTSDELISYEGEKATGNGDFDTILYSPMSICSSSSDRTELFAQNLDGVDRGFGGAVFADEICGAAAEDTKIGADCAEDVSVVGGVMEDENPADLQLEVNDEIGQAPQLMDFGSCSSVERTQAKPTVRKSLRVQAKVGRDNALDGWPKKKWMKRWMSRNKRSC